MEKKEFTKEEQKKINNMKKAFSSDLAEIEYRKNQKSGVYHDILFEDKAFNEIQNLRYGIKELYGYEADFSDVVSKLCIRALDDLNRKKILELFKKPNH